LSVLMRLTPLPVSSDATTVTVEGR
jgi:hypothetical protein